MSSEANKPIVINLPGSRMRAEENEIVRGTLFGHIDRGENRLVIDFATVDFVDSSFLGLLVIALKRATANGGDIKLCNLGKSVRSIFQLLRLHRVFDIYETVDSAVEAFS
ncbi:MAG: STAS domain-containing protein [bacterium]|nr:STAS domain-containing protein [Candidatus Sumerlaeota bacterium]